MDDAKREKIRELLRRLARTGGRIAVVGDTERPARMVDRLIEIGRQL